MFAAAEAAYMPKGNLVTPFNPVIVNTGSKLVLIDTGYGPGVYATADLALLKTICKDVVKIKATVSSLEQVHAAYAAGAERFGSLDAFAILDAWKAELEAKAKAAAVSE